MPSSDSLILYVDDDRDSGELIETMLHLADQSYRVVTFSTAGEVLAFLSESAADLYILDYRLPDLSGVELCRKIRETNEFVPILFYSGMARESDKESAFEAGATEYLVKPEDIVNLTEMVKWHLNESKKSAQIDLPVRFIA